MTPFARRRLVGRLTVQARDLALEWSGRDFCGVTPDTVAQAAVCAAPILGSCRVELKTPIEWLWPQLADWECEALKHATRIAAEHSDPGSPLPLPAISHLYDGFVRSYAADRGKRGGVFFTPQPIADYIVRRVDSVLQEDFGLADGLADDSAFRAPHSAVVLDPACGTGVFLLAVLDFLHARLADRWNDSVPQLLSRLVGIEILPAAALLAKVNMAVKLAVTGYDFCRGGRLRIECGDALDPNLQLAICNSQFAIPLILGNPPFSSLSTNTNPWIARLVRGDEKVRGYVQANGRRLHERKTWLHDDYVKFLRLAQWHVEQAGRGVVALVTNHGYLSNATFRLMRQELLRVFPRIEVLDLHGNRKAHEVAPDGSCDANVFGLEQGVAISLFSKGSAPARTVWQAFQPALADKNVCPTARTGVWYGELWGARDAKLAALGGDAPANTLPAKAILPCGPEYRFAACTPRVAHSEYADAWSLADAMPVHATAPVTARDRFVVAFSECELRRRIEEFCDLSIPDDEIRCRYFQRTRSARYEPGDTRGWKLAAARRNVAADPNWPAAIIRCLYRPFDWRYVFWHTAMIDWPRAEVTRHLVLAEPRPSKIELCCLIARRQQLPSQPCTFFWVADVLALDGVIRSDNRGSESLFPLYLREEAGWRANFATQFVQEIESQLRLEWLPLGRGNLTETFGTEDLLGYIYAIFHSARYRQDYADELRCGFPRVLWPRGGESFARLSRVGRELIDLHLLRAPLAELAGDSIPDDVALFRAGGYVALRKWLQPAHRSQADPEHRRIAAAIAGTLQRMQQIDDARLER